MFSYITIASVAAAKLYISLYEQIGCFNPRVITLVAWPWLILVSEANGTKQLER